MDLKYFYLLAVFSFICAVSDGSLREYNFDDLCDSITGNAILNIGATSSGKDSSFILRAVPNKPFKMYKFFVNCALRIIPLSSHFIVVSVRKIELRGGCIDNLTLSDNAGVSKTFCGKTENTSETDSVSFIGDLIGVFRTGGVNFESQIGYDGFVLTVTAYRRSPCLGSDFRCTNDRCISKDLKCDGHNHCGDRSEQLKCSCAYSEFTCSNGNCISLRKVCDGINDCGDFSDEKNCRIPFRTTAITFSKNSDTSVRQVVGAVLGCFFLLLAVFLGVIYYRRKVGGTVRRTVVTRQTPQTGAIHHLPPPSHLTIPSPVMPHAQEFGNPYSPLNKEIFDPPPPYSAVGR